MKRKSQRHGRLRDVKYLRASGFFFHFHNTANYIITMTPNLSPPQAPHMDNQGINIDSGPIVPDVAPPESPQYAFTYHEALDATLLLYSRDTSPEKLVEHADHLGHTCGFPAAPSFIESRLMGLDEPLTPTMALAANKLSQAGRQVVCPEDFANIGHRPAGMPLLWNGHCDAWISEMDEEDWVIWKEIQEACGFEPEIELTVVRKRLIDLAPYSRSWVSKVLPQRKGLARRIDDRYEKWHRMHIEIEGREINKDALTSSPSGVAGDKSSLIRPLIHPATWRAIERLPYCRAISRAYIGELLTSPTRDKDVELEQQRLQQLSEAGEMDGLEHFTALRYLMVAKTAGSASGFGEVLCPASSNP